jgi:hypothetical protein
VLLRIPNGLGQLRLLNLKEGNQTFYKGHLVVAENASKQMLDQMQEANPEVRDLWYWKGRILYTEFVRSMVHSHICSLFGRANDTGNRINRNYRMACDYDVNQSFGEAKKAPDVSLRLWERYRFRIKAPTIVGEVGYNTNLEELYNLANVYFPDQGENEEQANENEEPNDIMGYFSVKITYPYSIAHPEQFQMLFLYFEHDHDPPTRPTKVVSCGTLPVSDHVIALLQELTDLNPLDPLNNDIFQGHGFGGPPCNIANGANPIYSIRFPGDVMVRLDRAGTHVLPNLDDPTLYHFDFSLLELQQVVEESFVAMGMIGDNQPALAQAMLQKNLTQAAGGALSDLTDAEIRARANQLSI